MKTKCLYVDLNNIKLSDGSWNMIMKVITNHEHPFFGNLTITSDNLKEVKKNFDAGVRGPELPVDYFHNNFAEASGWIKELKLENNDTELWAKIEFTEKAQEMIKNKEIKYFSPEYEQKYFDKEGNSLGFVLLGGGLTNRPFLDLSPIQLSEGFYTLKNEGSKDMEELKKLTEENIKLSETAKNLTSEKETLAKRLSEIEAEKIKLQEEIDTANAEKAKADFEASFQALVDEGKIIPALKAWFEKYANTKEAVEEFGKNMIKIAEPESGKEGEENVEMSDNDKVALSEFGLSPEHYKKMKEFYKESEVK